MRGRKTKKKLEESILKTVDKTLKEIFTETGTLIIYDYLEKNHCLRWDKISEEPETFAKGLEKFLSSGASPVERVILQSLYASFGLKYETKENYTFIDYIAELKKSLSAYVEQPLSHMGKRKLT